MRRYPSCIAMMSTIELVHYARFASSIGTENEQAFAHVDGEIEGYATGLRDAQIERHERVSDFLKSLKVRADERPFNRAPRHLEQLRDVCRAFPLPQQLACKGHLLR